MMIYRDRLNYVYTVVITHVFACSTTFEIDNDTTVYICAKRHGAKWYITFNSSSVHKVLSKVWLCVWRLSGIMAASDELWVGEQDQIFNCFDHCEPSHNYSYSVSQKNPPKVIWHFKKIFTNGWQFLIDLYVFIYARLQIFIQLSPTLIKLCH